MATKAFGLEAGSNRLAPAASNGCPRCHELSCRVVIRLSLATDVQAKIARHCVASKKYTNLYRRGSIPVM